MSIAISLHLLAVVIWVGGMFFAYMALRPAAAQLLDPPQRLPLWVATFGKFFPWVWVSVVALPVTGYWIIGLMGGMANAGIHVHIMQGLGWLMILLYMHVFFAPFKKLKRRVIEGDWPEAAVQLNRIRRTIGINLILGLITVIIGGGGRYLSL